ncbi:MAG: D-glycero-beta-D-manno-heptose 1-phosphate adenylyltransferase [Flavobacteriales bacterium]
MNTAFKKLESKIVSLSEAQHLVNDWKNNGLKVVFTNGCFDILHSGHLQYLSEASQLGNKLVVGLNADVSVKILKGESRPINNENARAQMLAALFFVDLVVLFPEETPKNLIESLTPNILVKGGDYSIDTIVGGDHVLKNGGQVLPLSFVEGFSSTNIINKIKSE